MIHFSGSYNPCQASEANAVKNKCIYSSYFKVEILYCRALPVIMAPLLGHANGEVKMYGELWWHLMFLSTHVELQGVTHIGVLLLIRRISWCRV